MENVKKTNGNQSNIHKTLKLDDSLEKNEIKKLLITYSTLTGFLMIPLNTLNDEGNNEATELLSILGLTLYPGDPQEKCMNFKKVIVKLLLQR